MIDNQKSSRLCAKILIFTGAFCILTSFSMYVFVYIEDYQEYKEFRDNSHLFNEFLLQDKSSVNSYETEVEEVAEVSEIVEVVDVAKEEAINSSLASTHALYSNNSTEEKVEEETIIINGEHYIGVLRIDKINLNLPIHQTWTDAKLDTAPCVYSGGLVGEDLIVGAHNTRAHFSGLSTLETGDTATITDATGKEYKFVLKEAKVISEMEVRILENIRYYPLTLFTCDDDSRKRLVQRWVYE